MQGEVRVDENHSLIFGPFRFDCTRDRLWRGQQAIELRAKPLAVLRYLLQHPGQLVTRSEFLKEVWPGIYVSMTRLRACVREIRLALGDDITTPQYIETIGRQGYRFIAPLTSAPPVASSQYPVDSRQKVRGDSPSLTTGNW